jgi:arginyl-tRNA synthetase
MNVLPLLQQAFGQALSGLVSDPDSYAAMVRPAQDSRHGDYQANCAMPLAKALGRKPRDVAEEIVRRLDLGDWLEPPEIAGPGFINLRLRNDWLAGRLQRIGSDERLGVTPAVQPLTFVLDFSSPNIAKPMHVGHLRSTIIGDALTRLLRFLGHRVITDNHLGDWGTQFGMLLYGYKRHRDEAALQADPVREMVRFYVLVRRVIEAAEQAEDNAQEAAQKYTADQLAHSRQVLEAVRLETARLHAGDPENVQLWQKFIPWGMAELEPIYRRLDVHFDHVHGESFYNAMLPDVVRSLRERGIAEESQGAIVVPFEGRPPAIVQKRDGAFTYTTSDLATIRYRMEHWHPDALLYVVGAPQALHFQNLFEAARRWGYDQVELRHLAFGSVMEKDAKTGKPRMIKTREGGATELEALLDEAAARAARQYEESVQERRAQGQEVPDLGAEEQRAIAEAVGIGAVKYADLSQNRTSDYVFNWDKMLAMDGNTATYMQYAYTRNRGILRKAGEDERALRAQPPPVYLEHPAERSLGLQLLRFEEALKAAEEDYKPNMITSYLWDLAKAYSVFNENCPVLRASTPVLRHSRLLLCDLTARTVQRALELLGIHTIERM